MANDNNPGKKTNEYSAQSIRVMEGLSAVRKRPAMYIGSTGPQGLHHLVYEVVDNSVDEALGGHCDNVKVILHTDGSCSVEDNGRGIPTDIHPSEGVSAAEVVLTKLHAGGKFDKESYKFSGGLHGVGISVVNALSSWLKLTVFQHHKVHEQYFECGIAKDSLHVTGDTEKRGTLIQFMPDSTIFTETTEFSFELLSARLRELAFLNKKLKISISDERTDRFHEFYFEGGIVSFVEFINKKKNPLFTEVIHFESESESLLLDIALQYNDGYGEQLFSFVNNINTVEGGTHVSGFRSALTKICNKKASEFNLIKSGAEGFSSEDVREGLVGVISIKVPEPQFEGQTKTKLGNSEIKGIVDSWCFANLETFFEENPTIARKILQKAELAKHAREAAKKARDLTRRKTVLESTLLPGKLADCNSEEPAKTELFIVEGDSAGGSAKIGRDRLIQAILPLKGKILNVEKARFDKILSNEEIRALITAIGCGIGTEFDVTKARYHKIILMTDADVDGSHIRTLLLTFFFRYMTPLIEAGYLYIAQPPLYKAKIGKKEQYLKDDKAFKSFLFDWAREQTELSFDGTKCTTEECLTLINALAEYEELLAVIGTRFYISSERCDHLIVALYKSGWQPGASKEFILSALKAEFPEYTIHIKEPAPTAVNQEAIEAEDAIQEYFAFSLLNTQWSVPYSFFEAAEVKRLVSTLILPIIRLEEEQWALFIKEKERSIAGHSIIELVRAISAISKPYLNIQRYKGLGEMNADQLWETAMDPAVRSLLKVNIEDALEADRWFTSLMGDDVSGRKEYIEKYGQFAKNLDI